MTRGDPIVGYGLFGRAERVGYVQRLAVHPDAQGPGLGPALLPTGCAGCASAALASAFVNTQVDNDRALRLYERAGFRRLPVGLCVLGRNL